MTPQSISDLLTANGYEAEDGKFVKREPSFLGMEVETVINPADWVGLSVEGFTKKAREKGWIAKDTAGASGHSGLVDAYGHAMSVQADVLPFHGFDGTAGYHGVIGDYGQAMYQPGEGCEWVSIGQVKFFYFNAKVQRESNRDTPGSIVWGIVRATINGGQSNE
jgi:hypothetical protein